MINNELIEYIKELKDKYDIEQENIRLEEEQKLPQQIISQQNIKKIYNSIIQGTLLQTYIDVTGDTLITGQGNPYDVHLRQALEIYVNEIWMLQEHSWMKYIGEKVQITKDQYWNHYYPYEPHIMCHGIIGFGLENKRKPLVGEERRLSESAYKHAQQHYHLENLETVVTIPEQLLKDNNTQSLTSWIQDRLNVLDKKVEVLVPKNYGTSLYYMVDQDIRNENMNVLHANPANYNRTMPHGGMMYVFKLFWLIMNGDEKI